MKQLISTNKFIIMAALIAVAVLVAAGWAAMGNGGSQDAAAPSGQSDAQKFAKEYPKASPNNPFVYVSEDKIISTFDSGTGLVFLGFTECPWCQYLVEIVDEAAQAEKLDTVYYLNIRQARQSKSNTYEKLVANLEQYLDKDENDEPIIYVPDVTAVKDGKIVGRYDMAEASEAESKSPESYWTDERKEQAVESMRLMIREM